jgi:hypothetical protein
MTAVQGSPGRIQSTATPRGPPILCPENTAASQSESVTGTLPQAWAASLIRTAFRPGIGYRMPVSLLAAICTTVAQPAES